MRSSTSDSAPAGLQQNLILWDNGKATKPAHLTPVSMNLSLSPPSVLGHNSAASFVLAQAIMQWRSELVVQPKQKIQQPRKIALTDQCTTSPAAMPLCSTAKAVVVNTHNFVSQRQAKMTKIKVSSLEMQV